MARALTNSCKNIWDGHGSNLGIFCFACILRNIGSVMELADMQVLGACAVRRAGSTPARAIQLKDHEPRNLPQQGTFPTYHL